MRILGVVSSSSREVPGAPTIGTATDVGTGRAYNNGAATVTFTAPTWNGGLPITSYTATSSPGGFTGTAASSPITVTGLQSNTNYTFTVKATNAVGQSAASAASNSILATTVPQAPTIGTATDLGTGSTVSVGFTGNATGGKAVSTYTATSSPGSITGSSATSPITVSGLTAGTAYTFTVTATNANGTSTASAVSNSVTPTVPSSYESISTINASGSTSITFSSIPSTYKSLQIRFSHIPASGGSTLLLRANNTSLSQYNTIYGAGNGSATNAGPGLGSETYIRIGFDRNGTITSYQNVGIIDIIDYTSTSKLKTFRANTGCDANGSGEIEITSGLWRNTAAISSITIYQANNSGMTGSFALYGIKG